MIYKDRLGLYSVWDQPLSSKKNRRNDPTTPIHTQLDTVCMKHRLRLFSESDQQLSSKKEILNDLTPNIQTPLDKLE